MNFGLQLQEEGFNAGNDVDGTPLVHVRTGKQFIGIIESINPLEPANMLFGSDLRESAILHVLRPQCPPILDGDRIQDFDSFIRSELTPPDPTVPVDPANSAATTPVVYKVTKRVDDPSDAVVRFNLVKVTEVDS
jgi:hypothetical protein